MKVSTKLTKDQEKEAEAIASKQALLDRDMDYIQNVRNRYADRSLKSLGPREEAIKEFYTPNYLLQLNGLSSPEDSRRYYQDFAKVLQDSRTEHIDYLMKNDLGHNRADSYLEMIRNKIRK